MHIQSLAHLENTPVWGVQATTRGWEPLLLLRCSFPSVTNAFAFPATQDHPTGDRVLLENKCNRK